MRRFNFGKDKKHGEEYLSLVPFKRFDIDSFMESFFSEPFGSFGIFGGLKAFKAPAIDVYEKDNKVIVKADLPGINKENIKLHLDGDILTISGEAKREREEKKEKEGYYYAERSFGKIARSIRLPEGVTKDQIKASYKDGVLNIEMPRTKEAREQGKDIEIE